MFHRSTGSIAGGDHNVALSSRPVPVRAPQNENFRLAAKASSTSTPTAPRSRRAFGDISNKKAPASRNGKDQSKNSNHSSTVLIVKPSTNQSKIGSGGASKFQSRIPKTAGSKLTKRSHPWSTNVSSSSNPSPQVSSTRQVDFILPTSTRPVQKEPEVISISATPAEWMPIGPVDDVELPAGRLWEQQLKTDDPLGEDDLSTSSLGEILDQRTMWDDWKETMMQKWEQDRQQKRLEDEYEIKNQIDRFLQDDRKAGLESLMDDIHTLSLQDFFAANAVNLERLDDNDDDDDNWSEPASSVVEALALDF